MNKNDPTNKLCGQEHDIKTHYHLPRAMGQNGKILGHFSCLHSSNAWSLQLESKIKQPFIVIQLGPKRERTGIKEK